MSIVLPPAHGKETRTSRARHVAAAHVAPSLTFPWINIMNATCWFQPSHMHINGNGEKTSFVDSYDRVWSIHSSAVDRRREAGKENWRIDSLQVPKDLYLGLMGEKFPRRV